MSTSTSLVAAAAEAAQCMREMAEWAIATGMPETAGYLNDCASQLEAEHCTPVHAHAAGAEQEATP